MADSSSLRSDLAGYTRDNIARIIGPDAMAALDRDEAVPASMAARRVLADDSMADADRAVALLVRLLWLGEEITTDEMAQAFPTSGGPGAFGESENSDVISIEKTDAGNLIAHFQLVPFGDDMWFASDRGSLQGARHGSEHIMGIGGATRTLASLASYAEGQRVLDLGTGCGIHAILAAKAGADVVATDISQRALVYAQFNAKLNDVTIDVRLGSLFEPVEGEQFDVIVSNPPFVITPGGVRESLGTMEYRDGGAPGDTLAAAVVAGTGEHLRPGGRAFMLSNWEIAEARQGQIAPEWHDHPRAWLESSDCDAVVIQRETISAPAYVEMWLRDGGLRPGDSAYASTYEAWLGDFVERGVGAVGFGYIALARPSAGTEKTAPAREFAILRGQAPDDLAGYVERLLGSLTITEDNLDSHTLYQQALTEHRFYIPGEEDPWIIKFSQLGGFGEEVQADTALAGFVSVCSGELTAGQIIAALAQLLGRDEGELRAELAPRIIHMVRLGMLATDAAE